MVHVAPVTAQPSCMQVTVRRARKLATRHSIASKITQTLGQSGTFDRDHPSPVMIALGLLLFSSTTFASACIDWKSMDLKKPEIPLMDDLDVFIEESQSVDIQVSYF